MTTQLRERLDREASRVHAPSDAMDAVLERVGRKVDRRRTTARVLGLAIALALIGGSLAVFRAGALRDTGTDDVSRDRLLELGEAWFRTPATVSYRTTGPVPGQPTTAHLCLRQMFDHDYGEDRTDLLRRCSRQGTLRLVWDPPDVWQMDVTTPVDRFALASTHHRTQVCRRGDPHACRAIPTDEAIVKARADVFFQGPRKILAAIGATGVKTIASPTGYDGLSVECFAATGRDEHVEWCYSVDGLLLSFLRGSATEGWTSIEATSISRSGAD